MRRTLGLVGRCSGSEGDAREARWADLQCATRELIIGTAKVWKTKSVENGSGALSTETQRRTS